VVLSKRKRHFVTVPCARHFSSEVTIYVRGFLAMRILPFSYPHPFLPPSVPWIALLNSRPLPCRTSPRKHSLEIRFRNRAECPVIVVRRRDVHLVIRKFVLSVFCFQGGIVTVWTWTPRRIYKGGFCFLVLPGIIRHSFSLYYFIWFCIILCFLAYSLYYTLL
jgi:hypothetical protein